MAESMQESNHSADIWHDGDEEDIEGSAYEHGPWCDGCDECQQDTGERDDECEQCDDTESCYSNDCDDEIESDQEHNFPQFSKLPKELRLKIWKLGSFLQRNVHIATTDIQIDLDPAPTMTPFRYRSRTPPPAILHVCREARHEALRHYQLDFGVSMVLNFNKLSETTIIAPRRIYINWEIDRVCVLTCSDFCKEVITADGSKRRGEVCTWRKEAFAGLCEKRNIRYLAFPSWDDTDKSGCIGIPKNLVPWSAPSLKELTLLTGSAEDFRPAQCLHLVDREHKWDDWCEELIICIAQLHCNWPPALAKAEEIMASGVSCCGPLDCLELRYFIHSILRLGKAVNYKPLLCVGVNISGWGIQDD